MQEAPSTSTSTSTAEARQAQATALEAAAEPAPTSLEEALAQITKLREENVRLKKHVLDLEGPAPRNKFVGRVAIKSILGRSDQGEGLIGSLVIVAGWVRTIRLQGGGKFAFVNLNDGTFFEGLQIVVDSDKPGFDVFKRTECATGASMWFKGRIVKSPGKKQKVELLAVEVDLVGGCDPLKYPLAPKEHSMEFLREVAHLRARTNTISAVMRVRNALAFATHKFFQEKDFVYMHTPLITTSDCEGAGEMFQVTTLLSGAKKPEELPTTPGGELDYAKDFFGRPAYLTVSGQLNGEHYASALSNIYTFGPTFRAEDSNTRRHLAEFWMIEPEMAFYDLHDCMDLAEAYVKYAIKYALDTCPEDMQFLDKNYKGEGNLLKRLLQVVSTPFKRITYTQAIDALLKSKKTFEEPVSWGIDLSSEHERYLTEQIFKTPVIVTDYPKSFKAFYMRLNEDQQTVAAMDVLMPTLGELIGGSQREERLDVLIERFKEKGLPQEPYQAYLDLRRFGSVPHAGFGLGFERLVLFTTGIENIRDSIPFPRYPKHALF
jgi:asparaginyl-tRNA synthetase